MAYDLRDFIEDLKKAGELVEIDDEVDWNYEIAAYEVASARFDGPALLFNRIKGIPEGPRVAVGLFAGSYKRPHKRCAIALGLDPNLDKADWFREIAPRMGNVLRPVEVATGPCKEIIRMGSDVNLLEFPFVYHATGDGGRYVFLNNTTIRDPDSDWLNTGNYGMGIYSRNRLVLTPYGHTNFVSIYNTKYQARNQSMPVAIALGGDPAVIMAAGMVMPPGVTEYDVAAGFRGMPIELVKAETSDLLVPANAEVVIEGEVRPFDRLPEGPKVEAFGFSVGPRQPFYAMRVHCITHRKNPLICDTHTAAGTSSDSLNLSFLPLGYLAQIKAFGLPLKFGSLIATRGGGTMCHVVRKQAYPEDYPGFMEDLKNKVSGQPGMSWMTCNCFIDEDVNFLNLGEFYEAMFTQTNPARDVVKSAFKYPTASLECSWMEDEDRAKYVGPGMILSPRLFIDATSKEEPPQGVQRLTFETLYPPELQEWVVQQWKHLGFTEEPMYNKSWLEFGRE